MKLDELFGLKGKIALVTGASRGIGEAVARALAGAGAHVIVSSRKIADCERVVASIREAGGSAEAMACHIGEMDQIQATWAAIDEKHGRLDILVNNAAANPYFGPLAGTDLGAYQKTVDVNI
ncbi:MAG: SDR family NAD(P)-dependent oxidoreductase, partial [Dongiaceae bacterium]